MKKLGLYENSLIIICSDHGEAFGERHLIGHGKSVYQDQIHVPLLIKYPNINKRCVVDKVVSVVDLMPTIFDVLGYELTDLEIQGSSLLRSESPDSLYVLSESFPPGWLFKIHQRFQRIERAVFSDSLKFISSTAGKKELYDLSTDKNEMQNLYKVDDTTSKQLEMKLNQWLEITEGELESSPKLDKDTLDRLKSLGYIQ